MGGPIQIKTSIEVEAMRKVCRFAAELLNKAGEMVRPGISTDDINTFVHEYTMEHGGISAPLNYGADPIRGIPPFPKSVCTSVNDVVCHGVPSRKTILKEGDIVNIDVTPILGGFHGDCSKTFFVGKVSEEVKKLVETAEYCLMLGIQQVAPDKRIRDIGAAIQDYAEPLGYGVVQEYVGHGIGRRFHEAPQIPHYRAQGENPRLKPGMIFTIEPMINLGSHETRVDSSDGWTVRTRDGKWSAQFEHTVLVTESGVEILTQA